MRRARVHVEVDRLEHHVSAELEDSSPHGSASRQSTPRGPAARTEQTRGWPALLAQPQDPPRHRRRAASHASDYRAPRQAASGCRRRAPVAELSSGRSGNALPRTCAQSRTRTRSSSAPLAAADSRDLFHAVIELRRARPGRRHGAGVGHRRGQRCGDAGVHQADDACIGEAASARAALPATLALDEQRASAGARSAPASLLHLWRRSKTAPPLPFAASGAAAPAPAR